VPDNTLLLAFGKTQEKKSYRIQKIEVHSTKMRNKRKAERDSFSGF